MPSESGSPSQIFKPAKPEPDSVSVASIEMFWPFVSLCGKPEAVNFGEIYMKRLTLFLFWGVFSLSILSEISMAKTFRGEDVGNVVNKIDVEGVKTADKVNSITAIAHNTSKEIGYLVEAGTVSTPGVLTYVRESKKDWRVRYLLMSEVLAKTKDISARPTVVAILKNKKENISVRSAAIKVLGKMGGAESLSSIKEVADENLDNQEFQSSVLRSLADIGGSQGGAIITSRLKHKDAFIKTVAVRALYQLAVNAKDMAQVKPLIEIANDSQFENRNVAIKLLGEAKEKQALPVIIKMAENIQEDYTYRCTAVEALGNIGGEGSDKVLLGLLSDNDELLRGYAAEALAKGKNSPEKVIALKTALNSTKDTYVKSKIAKAQSSLETKR